MGMRPAAGAGAADAGAIGERAPWRPGWLRAPLSARPWPPRTTAATTAGAGVAWSAPMAAFTGPACVEPLRTSDRRRRLATAGAALHQGRKPEGTPKRALPGSQILPHATARARRSQTPRRTRLTGEAICSKCFPSLVAARKGRAITHQDHGSVAFGFAGGREWGRAGRFRPGRDFGFVKHMRRGLLQLPTQVCRLIPLLQS